MRSRPLVAFAVLASLTAPVGPAHAGGPPRRKLLNPTERLALVALLDAVDAAEGRDGDGDAPIDFDHHVLKSRDETAYVAFRVTPRDAAAASGATAMYVRAVSRHDGFRAADERSTVRNWLARGGDQAPARQETVFVGPGEMPVGGPAASSSRRSTQAPAESSAILALQQREFEKQRAAEDARRAKGETKRRDPYLFPFEEYYFVDLKPHGAGRRSVERALALPAGEYDVYVALVDESRVRSAAPAVYHRTLTIPDYWNDRLALSSLILINRVNTLKAPLSPEQQLEHPYTFGRAEVITAASATFARSDVLSIAYQICNYGAPDTDLTAEYTFYRDADGERRLFNRTPPQQLTDRDLPTPGVWETQAFVSQAVPLESFPAGRYELEVSVRDRLTRDSAKQTVAFAVR
jgi:hypothetical protein